MSADGAPLLVALAIDIPEREALLLRLLHDPTFVVGGRACEVAKLCASTRDLDQVLNSGTFDAAIVSSQLNAMPPSQLVSLAHRQARLVVLAPDPAEQQWDTFPGGLVLGLEPGADLLARALGGDRASVADWRHHEAAERHLESVASALPVSAGGQAVANAVPRRSARRGLVIAVAGAYQPSGRSLVAAELTCALGVAGPAVLVDADVRFGTTPWTLGMSNGYSLCQLVDKRLDSAEAWDAALGAELQPMGSPSQAMVLAGVPRPSMRPRIRADWYERLVEALAERFPFVVLDTAGGGWSSADGDIDGASLRLADRILLVIRPDVQGVALAREALDEWRSGRERIGLVLNQVSPRGREAAAEIGMVLELDVLAVIPSDPRGVEEARRRRRPIVCQRNAKGATPLLDLAARLRGGGRPIVVPPDAEPAHMASWWRRLAPAGAGGLFR